MDVLADWTTASLGLKTVRVAVVDPLAVVVVVAEVASAVVVIVEAVDVEASVTVVDVAVVEEVALEIAVDEEVVEAAQTVAALATFRARRSLSDCINLQDS